MKKQIVAAVSVIVLTLLVVMLYVIESLIGTGDLLRAEQPYYKMRVSVETEMFDLGIKDSKELLQSIDNETVGLDEIKSEVKEKLSYSLNHFPELAKGDDSDMEIVKELYYSLTYLYMAVQKSDYDGGYKTTEKEKSLRNSLVHQYVRAAFKYADNCASLTQKEEDFETASQLGQKIEGDIENYSKVFAEALWEVVKEAREKNLI